MSSDVDHPGPQPQPPATPGDFPSDSDNRESSPEASFDSSSLPRAVKARKAEYTRKRSIRVKVGTWNVAALPGTEQDVGNWFADRKGLDEEFSEIRVSGPERKSGDDSDDATEKEAPPSETGPNAQGETLKFQQRSIKVRQRLTLTTYLAQRPCIVQSDTLNTESSAL